MPPAFDQLTPALKAHGGLGRDFFKGRSWGFGQAVSHDLTVIVLTQRMFERSDAPQVHHVVRRVLYARATSNTRQPVPTRTNVTRQSTGPRPRRAATVPSAATRS